MAVFQRFMLCFSILLLAACSSLEQGKKLNSNEADAFQRFVKVLDVGELREIELNEKFDDLVLSLNLRIYKNKQEDIESILKFIGTTINTYQTFELKGKASPFLSQLFYMNEGESVNRAILYYVIGQRLKLPIGISIGDNGVWVTWKDKDGYVEWDTYGRGFNKNNNPRYRIFSPDEVIGLVYEGLALRVYALDHNKETMVLGSLQKATIALSQDIFVPTLYEYFRFKFKKSKNCNALVKIAEEYSFLDYTNFYAHLCFSDKGSLSENEKKYLYKAEEIKPNILKTVFDWRMIYIPWDSHPALERMGHFDSIIATFFRAGDLQKMDSSVVINNKLMSSVMDYEQANRLQGRNASQFFSIPFYSNNLNYSDDFFSEYFNLLQTDFSSTLYAKDENADISELFDQFKINSLTKAIIYISFINEVSTKFKLEIRKGIISVFWEKGDDLWTELRVGETSIKGEYLLTSLDEVKSFIRENTARKQFANRFENQSLIDAALVNATGAVALNPHSKSAVELREEILSEVDGRRTCQPFYSSLLNMTNKNNFHFYFSNCLYANLSFKEARSELSKMKDKDIRAKLLEIKLDIAEQKNTQALAKLEKLKGQAPKEYDSKINDLLIRLKK